MRRYGPSLLHGLFLCLMNMGGVLVGYEIWVATGAPNQVSVQVPTGIVLSTAGFLVWVALSARITSLTRGLAGALSLAATFISALIWAPVIFVPLHHGVTGYWTSRGNIVACWFFQLPANGIALLTLVAWRRLRSPVANDQPRPGRDA
ncbi:hypothetical protein KKG45_07050 [bacterium]|nr:hypothetical protein [bacterium]MBU1072987.1 hypothetical protein [bacterium]